MSAIVDRPIINTSNPYYKPNYFCHGLSYFCCPTSSRVSLSNFIRNSSKSSRLLNNSCRQIRVSISTNFCNSSVWRREKECSSNTRIRANSSCEQDTDSTTPSSSSSSSSDKKKDAKQVSKGGSSNSSSSSSSSSSPRREKEGKSWFRGAGGKWRWQPLIQAQEIGVLLLQLGIVMFVMRLLRPGIPLPGSEPRPPTTFVSVPYSEFLSKINGNQVQKVEVDGVHIMFKLKNEGVSGVVEGEMRGSESNLQDSELLLRSVAPTKRIVYTTTRPVDIKTPYEKMLDNHVEFGSPDKRSGGFLNSALVSC